ncbi:zinc transporter ZIP10 [Pristis pectinata]|uniref:zinc transporter ZIP10 n=1 Tax=Pristis pectinata TaxID=685728 RepID=UPI00223DA13F|nr:zinc transporter ZIP10 [Pristis pectinata]
MKCGVLTVFLTGLLAPWAHHGWHCQAQTRSVHRQRESPAAGSNASAPSGHGPPGKDRTASHSAVLEQRYYLLQLFQHYGENGKLSFDGLSRLLANLGLGEVQVLEIEHEDMGHDHVSHLDLLDLQENRHVHSHTALEHMSAPAHDHRGHRGRGNHPESSADGSAMTSTVGLARRTQRKSPHPAWGRGSTLRGKRLERRSATGRSGEVARGRGETTRPPPAAAGDSISNHSKFNHLHGNCLNVSQLLINFGMSTVHEITPKQFSYICPALLYQIDSRVCIYHHDSLEFQQEARLSKSVWLWGFIAITLTSLTSLVAVAFVPFLSRSFSGALLPFLVALAIGTLSADALLHLIPHAQVHRHKVAENTGARPLLKGKDSLWKGLSVLGGIYLLLLIESLLGLIRSCSWGVKSTGKRQRREQAGRQMGVPASTELHCLKPAPESDGRTEVDLEEGADGEPFTASKPGTGARGDLPNCWSSGTGVSEEQELARGHSHGHPPAARDLQDSGIVDIAWMVIMGDGVHNFTDGLAIGAAFSTGISGGLSTTIAVFCHELPHELGDFAVLMQAGMKVRQAVTFNLVSAVLSYVGMALGIAAGQYTDNITPWIFASTAGMFLYVALVDMLPELLRAPSDTRHRRHLSGFVRENLGFLLGAGVMLCIALFEDRLLIDISS